MTVDFRRLTSTTPSSQVTEPRRIFAALPSRTSTYAFPRDVQSEVWNLWHSRRDESDLLIKMNTGSGKTVVGLLILQSALNERSKPCVYVVADKFLAEQVQQDAADLGLRVTTDPRSPQFKAGNSILIVNIHKLVNGRSVFGTSARGQRIDVDTLLIDDVHACVTRVEEQFTLDIPSEHPAYAPLLRLFKRDLEDQSREHYRGIVDGDNSYVLQIPFWKWVQKQNEVFDLLYPYREEEDFLFRWPLISEHLPLCRAGISSKNIQIAPPFPIINAIPTIPSATHRIYMTATVPDNSVLFTHFGASTDSISRPITPSTASDVGDRMILMPNHVFPYSDDTYIHSLLVDFAKVHNVVILTPSLRRAQVWKELGAIVYDRHTIKEGVEELKHESHGLAVFVNKYDGIDLPDKACRLLVIDGLPESYGELERLDQLALNGTAAFLSRQIQRIEQGMGRGIRSNEDWCVVFLLGRRLTERIYTGGALEMFSPATRAQLQLSQSLTNELQDRPISEFNDTISRFLDRDPEWITASRSVLDGLSYEDEQLVSKPDIAMRTALNHAINRQYNQAVELVDEAINQTTDKKLRGWLKSQSAAYQHHSDPVLAQRLLLSANMDNPAITHPADGVAYQRLAAHADQGKRCSDYLTEQYSDSTSMVLGFRALLDDLVPHPDTTEAFEEAWHLLGLHLGFASQRPERDTGIGPDVLWMFGDGRAGITECKSGVTNDFISKTDASQLGQAIDWFREQYDDSSYKPVGLLIHRTNVRKRGASTREGTRVITFSKLNSLCEQILEFAKSVSNDNRWQNSTAVGERLVHFGLTASLFVDRWALPTKKESKHS